MKLHRLELEGFGPFRDRQAVDFDAFDDDGVFLITGRTGAGKSSVLDGISFALYGSVPRYDGGEKRLRSDHCRLDDPTEVRLEVTVADRRLRITRAPEYQRPAKRGGGLTTEPQRAELEELVAGTWVGRASRPRDVALALDEVLGLSAQQFQQVILLAQNRFSRFLLAKNDERQALLRTLFGTRRFEDYKESLDVRRRAAQRGLDAAGTQAGTFLDLAERLIDERGLAADGERSADLAGRRDSAVRAQQRAAYRVETLTNERMRADAAALAAADAHARLVASAKVHADLLASRDRLARLEEETPAIEALREQMLRARAAEELRSTLDDADHAASAAHAARMAAASARAEWTAAGGATEANLRAVIDTLTGQLAVWTVAATQERELASRRAELDAAESAVRDHESDLAQLDEQHAHVPAERSLLDEALVVATEDAGRVAAAEERHDALRAQLSAAVEAVQLSALQSSADEQYVTASEAADAAGLAVTALLHRRLAGYAGELAADLVDGEPCAVCGSTAHPRPAAESVDPVTDDVLARAEVRRDEAAASARASADAARDARDRLSTAVARAGGAEPDALEADAAAALLVLQSARAAVAERERLTRSRAELDERDAAYAARRTDLVGLLDADRTALAVTRSLVATLVSDVEAARGEAESVAARVLDADRLRGAARECLTADERAAELDRASALAERRRDERIEASIFDDGPSARAALVDPAGQASAEARIAEHSAARSAIRARVLELELEAVVSDVGDGDVASAAQSATEADTARTAAISAERDAHNAAKALSDLLQQADVAYADVATLADEAAVIATLADTVAGRAPNTMKMDLETFVLAAELEEIVAAANLRLAEMSSGRYTLHHTDARAARGGASGLGIDVLDAHTGQLRPPQSLSGGETFLASLALALGLAEVVTSRAGGIRLDTLFIDEGFGSLDPETLELAMHTLDELRAGGRTVGVISHVEVMKEQLPAQLVVTASPHGPSTITQDAS